MNRLWLKLIGCIVFVFVVIVAAYVFWPAEARAPGPREVKAAEQMREQGNDRLTREMKLRQLEARRSAAPSRFRPLLPAPPAPPQEARGRHRLATKIQPC